MNRLLCFAAITTLSLTVSLYGQNLAGDEALSKVLSDGENWQEVAAGFGFTDGACADSVGNFYFSDLSKGVVHMITPNGKIAPFLESGPRISGLKFGPDGRLYACTQGPKKQIIALALPSKEISVLVDMVQPNDLIVSAHGFVYFTETSKGQLTGLEIKTGRAFSAATGLNAPNGITLSPDGGTLAVSEYKGSNVWTYRVGPDGTLSAGAPYMTLRAPAGQADSVGDGMTVDAQGRYYVTSALGIQMFDGTGRMGGIIARPQLKGTVSCAFAGPGGAYLYLCSADKVYRRKTMTMGVNLFPSK